MKVKFKIEETFNVKPEFIYNAWLNSVEHSKMTGGEATCSNIVGGEFSAWDGYIFGKNIQLIQNKEIVQTWRTTEFNENNEDSELTIKLEELESGCKLILVHSNIPEGQSNYEQGWKDHYFTPMKNYFNG